MILLFEKIGVLHYVADLIQNNRGKNNPYHNTGHCLSVARLCYFGGVEEGLSEHEIRNLVISGIYHDIHHKGSVGDDYQNIQAAVEHLSKVILPEDILSFDDIKNIIEATEYKGNHKFKFTEKEITLSQKIIRDADMMSFLEDNWIHHTLGGMSQELGVKIDADFLQKEIEFVSDITFFTHWATVYATGKMSRIRESLELLKNSL